MRYFTLAVLLVIAASIGAIVGVLLVRPSGTTLAVTTVPREDQIVLGATGAANETTFSYVGGTRAPWLAFDAGEYPSSSVFRLEFIIDLGADQTTCVRLFDLTTDSDIPGSTMCATGAPSPQSQIDRRRLRSDPLTLPAGEHEYTLQGQSQVSIGGSSVQFSRIIVEWNEELVMNGGGGPPAVGGIVELRDAPDAQSDQPSSRNSLPLPASVAVGLMLLARVGCTW